MANTMLHPPWLAVFILASMLVTLSELGIEPLLYTLNQAQHVLDALPAWRIIIQGRLPSSIIIVLFAVATYKCLKPRKVFLVDFTCFQPDDDQKTNYEKSEYITNFSEKFTITSLEFQRKVYLRSGLGDETYLPYHIFNDDDCAHTQDEIAQLETKQAVFASADSLLRKTLVDPKEVDIVITNCSLYSPIPSIAAMLVNRYKIREDVKTFHLGGMGCSASVIACNLARDLLRLYPNKTALVISTENISQNWYFGNSKSRLVSNCLFRLGCAAMMLSNKKTLKPRSKYEFVGCVRTHKAADDRAYSCAVQMEDDGGMVGILLTKDLMGVAADALRTNIMTLGPKVLPWREQAMFAWSFMCRKLLNMKVKQYQPDFKLAFEHFVLHAGGRAVIDEIQKSLFLTDYHMEASRCTLHRFGNTSASCLWYVLAYMEAQGRIKGGDRVWMLGLGSGFKCNSAVWRALRDISLPLDSPWTDSLHLYPAAQKTR